MKKIIYEKRVNTVYWEDLASVDARNMKKKMFFCLFSFYALIIRGNCEIGMFKV